MYKHATNERKYVLTQKATWLILFISFIRASFVYWNSKCHVLIVYNSEEGKPNALLRREYSPAIYDSGKLLDKYTDSSTHAAMSSKNASDSESKKARWSIEATTFFTRGMLLHQHGQGTASGRSTAPLKNAQDYFITKKSGFPWFSIPDFVVGRAGVDNWLLVTALARRAAVVDASRTVTAGHQVRSGYQPSAHFTQPTGDAAVNYQLAGRSFDYSLGLTDCAPLETTPAPTSTRRQGTIDCDASRTVVLRRRPLNRYCRRAYVKLRGLRRLTHNSINIHGDK